MTPASEHVRHLLGAYVLGHLSEDEAAAVRAHLEGCEACRAEAGELAAVASVLPTADPSRIGATPEPPDDLLPGILERIDSERDRARRVRRRLWSLRAGVAAAVVLLAVGAFAIVLGPEEEGSGGELVALTSMMPGARGSAVVHRDPDATWLELNTSGMESGETYAVWLEETDGERSPAGTFVGVEGDLYISLYSTLPRDDAAAIGVSTLDGDTVMRADLER